ncbi:hypothetical protein PF008_g21875 [Phytophthora fragariae]|uniref:Uncharacterized protein n=1 Tax=Phytophthora fragariae TaxID=53985 RepID=A0A6G0QWB7_9STRA|nr:hypothetical protein PF008_g21875 [Phytophthora fragariae]
MAVVVSASFTFIVSSVELSFVVGGATTGTAALGVVAAVVDGLFTRVARAATTAGIGRLLVGCRAASSCSTVTASLLTSCSSWCSCWWGAPRHCRRRTRRHGCLHRTHRRCQLLQGRQHCCGVLCCWHHRGTTASATEVVTDSTTAATVPAVPAAAGGVSIVPALAVLADEVACIVSAGTSLSCWSVGAGDIIATQRFELLLPLSAPSSCSLSLVLSPSSSSSRVCVTLLVFGLRVIFDLPDFFFRVGAIVVVAVVVVQVVGNRNVLHCPCMTTM